MSEDELQAALAEAWEEGAEAVEAWVQELTWTNGVPGRPTNPYKAEEGA